MSFLSRMEQVAKSRKSNIVLALDFPFEKPENCSKLFSKAEKVLESVHEYICAVKFNHHLILPLGTFDGVQKLLEMVHDFGLLAIMDCKINDIGSTNQVIAEYYYAAGFDALIANPFIGWEEGLKPIFDVSRNLQRGVILLVYMSHKGASEGYGQTVIDPETGGKVLQYVLFARKALKYRAEGAVVGGTYPEKIREVYAILGEKVPIYSPGIGAQGGDVKAAIEAGARYLIVGRAITQAEDPSKAAKEIRDSAKRN
ncbi:MAG: orotidine 5'-phosphate decarboxylase [Candidatus Bathyarchaeota archaeon]|nr:orotidine 5'-phosphate decarboxylase [Candidatus Bathyarchaeota archaeon]MDI6805336.1 orotidine 5'-phosphate decarboxylase [Candidatus Bathyarchaeia archaeon]